MAVEDTEEVKGKLADYEVGMRVGLAEHVLFEEEGVLVDFHGVLALSAADCGGLEYVEELGFGLGPEGTNRHLSFGELAMGCDSEGTGLVKGLVRGRSVDTVHELREIYLSGCLEV